jgi:hypothetical protein
MKTNKFFSILAIMIGMVMSVSLVSCGDDDDDDNNHTTDPVITYNGGVMYKVVLSDDYYKYFDISAVCTDFKTGKDETLTFTKNDSILLVDKYTDIVKSYNFKVIATPKATAPAVEAGKTYTFNDDCALYTYYYDASATTVAPMYKYSAQTRSIVSSEDMPGFISQTWDVFSKSYTFNY